MLPGMDFLPRHILWRGLSSWGPWGWDWLAWRWVTLAGEGVCVCGFLSLVVPALATLQACPGRG